MKPLAARGKSRERWTLAAGPSGSNNHSPRIHPWVSKMPTPSSFPPLLFLLARGRSTAGKEKQQRACGGALDRHPWMKSMGYDCGARGRYNASLR